MLNLALTVAFSTLVASTCAQRDQYYDNSGYVPPYYDYYGNGYVLYTCAVPTDKPVYHCSGGAPLLITPSLASFGGPGGADPPSGYIEMSNVTYGWECAVDIQPAKVPGVNVRVRANCVSPITSNDTVTMDGSEGATGGLGGGVGDPTRFVTMGSEASLLYKAGVAPPKKGQDCVAQKDTKGKKKKGKKDNCDCEDEETTCDCEQKKKGFFAKIGSLFRKRKPSCDCADGSKGVEVTKKKKKGKKDKCGKKDSGNGGQGRRLLFDGATGGPDPKPNGTSTSPPTVLSYAAIFEYDVTPGCTPVDYSEKARRCYSSNSVSDPIKVYTSPNSRGKLTAEGPWASDCWYAFTVPTGYYVELTLGCLAAGVGNITITPTVGNETALTIGSFGEFLSCYGQEGGCTFEDEAPIVRFQLESSPWLTSMQQGYYYYDAYWLTTFSIDYEVKPIPGANITQGPAFECPAPPEGATVYTCANDVWTLGYENNTYIAPYDPYRGNYYFAYLSEGDEGYFYMPSYAAYQSCSAYLQASTADYEGTIDLEVICLDTEPDYDYLSFYGGGQYAALSGRVENSTYKDLGSLLSASFYADASVQGGGFLLKYKVRSSDRCPSPAYGYRTQTYICDSNWYVPSNETVVPVTLSAKTKGQFIVPQNAPPNCTFDIQSVPRGYELQVETSCVAASAGTLTVYGRDGSVKGSFGDTPYKTCTDYQCTIGGLKSGASLQFLSSYGGLQNNSYYYPYSYYYSYSESNKSDTYTDYYYEDRGHTVTDERHFDKVHRRRAQQWGYAYNETGYFYWYVTYSNPYPYWTPQLVVDYQLIRTNDPTDPADPPVNECVGNIVKVPAGADVLDLTPVEAAPDYNATTKYRRRSLRAPEGPAAMARRRLHRIGRRGLQEKEANLTVTDPNYNYTDYQPSYEPYVSKYPGYVYASVPVVVDQPFDPDTAPSGYLQMSSYGPNTYVTASLYMVSSNWMQPLGNDTTFEFDVICLDTEEGVDYLSIVGYGNQWSYDSYSRNYVTLSGSHTGETYESFGQNAYLSFYSDDSIESTGFLIRWRVVQSTGPTGGGGPNGPQTAGPDPKPDFRALGGALGPTTAFVEKAEGANVGLTPSEPLPIHDD